MNTTILNILCEGQTEERFANLVLKPYLKDYGIIVKCRLLITSKRKNAAGGKGFNVCVFKQSGKQILRPRLESGRAKQ